MVEQILDKAEKRAVSRKILEALTEWFEVEESREQYIAECADWIFLAAKEDGKPVGFLCLKETGRATAEVAVMGVRKEYQHSGIGRRLMDKAKEIAASEGYSFLQVKTVQMGKYADYDKTNLFYLSCGFQEFEVFPTLWDEENPCQVYVMSLR